MRGRTHLGPRFLGLALAAVGGAACSLPPEAVPDGGVEYHDVPYEGVAFPNRRASLGVPPEGLAVVADTLSDTLSVVDLSTRARIARLPVGRDPFGIDGPVGVVLDALGGAVYVPLAYPVKFVGAHAGHLGHGVAPGYVQKLGADDLRILGETAIDAEPTAIALSADGKRLVVSHFFQAGLTAAATDPQQLELARARITVLDPARVGDPTAPDPVAIRVCLGATGVALSQPDGARAYVACSGEDAIAIVRVADPSAPVTRVLLGPDAGPPAQPKIGPYAVAISPDGASLVVTTSLSKELRSFHVGARALTPAATVPLDGTPRVPDLGADGAVVYVPIQGPDALVALDPATGAQIARRDFERRECVSPERVVVRGRAPMLVLCAGEGAEPGRVMLVDPATLVPSVSIDVGLSPRALALVRGAGR